MPGRFLFLPALTLCAANAEAYGSLPPYVPEEPALSLWLVLGVLAFILAARRRRFDIDERS